MNKIIAGGLAALTLAGTLAASAPASAEPYRGHYYRHHDNSGAAIAAGIAGLAIGAAIAGGSNHGYDRYASRPVYYYDGPPPAYYAGPTYYSRYERCRTQWRWDRYYQEYVRVRACY